MLQHEEVQKTRTTIKKTNKKKLDLQNVSIYFKANRIITLVSFFLLNISQVEKQENASEQIE